MGYYANYYGAMRTKPLGEKDVTLLLEKLGCTTGDIRNIADDTDIFENFEVETDEIDSAAALVRYTFEVSGDDKYYDDAVKDFLHNLEQYLESGEIEYNGEDGSLWRFHFRDQHWYEDGGFVSYQESCRPLWDSNYADGDENESLVTNEELLF